MIKWFAENSSTLNLRVYRDRYVSTFLPEVSDYLVRIKVAGEQFWGRGISLDETNSLNAACAEVVERSSLQFLKNDGQDWSSSGIAAHTIQQEAQSSAIGELIERDAFFTHYLTRSPFYEITQTTLIDCFQQNLANEGIELRLGRMRSPIGWFSIVACCFGSAAKRPFGVFIGSATKKTLEEAVNKSIREAIALISGHLRTLAEDDFDTKTIGPMYNHRFGAETLHHPELEALLKKDTPIPDLKLGHIETEILPLHPAFEGCPVTVVRATSPDAQQLFFGETKPEHINFKRLSQFLGKEVRWEDVNKTTHVFA